MKVTFVLKDLSEAFYTGHGSSIVGLLNQSDSDKFARLQKMAGEKRVSMKIESGQFRDAVALNAMLRGPVEYKFCLAPRRGYKLATFSITRAT